METLCLVHLGAYVPPYLKDCVHQLRLWSNPEKSRIFIILDPSHREPGGEPTPFWKELQAKYAGVHLRFTDELEPTEAHHAFRSNYKGDVAFRNGYWRHVKERFFFQEELMRKEGIADMITMEYDVLLYSPIEIIVPLLRSYARGRFCYAMDTTIRGHPGFMYIPCADTMRHLNMVFLELVNQPYEDMQTLAIYKVSHPQLVATLPLITPARNASVPVRSSLTGNTCENTDFLSTGFEEMGCLFDSLSVGQCVGGVDPRNTEGQLTIGMINETALYSLGEMSFGWTKIGDLWLPVLDRQPLVTIHMHSKALGQFLSDRPDVPKADYDIVALKASLEPNERKA
jgi:hypothetical protein